MRCDVVLYNQFNGQFVCAILSLNNTRVHTAARDETGFFVGLMTASGALFAALAGRLKKERRA